MTHDYQEIDKRFDALDAFSTMDENEPSMVGKDAARVFLHEEITKAVAARDEEIKRDYLEMKAHFSGHCYDPECEWTKRDIDSEEEFFEKLAPAESPEV